MATVPTSRTPGSGTAYPLALRQRVVKAVNAGMPPADAARRFGMSEASIRAWVHAANGTTPQKRAPIAATGRELVPFDPHAALAPGGPLEELANLRDESDYMKRVVLWLVLKLAPAELGGEQHGRRGGRR